MHAYPELQFADWKSIALNAQNFDLLILRLS